MNALNDEPLRKYILGWEPKTMEAALYYASRSEAHDFGSALRVKERRDRPDDWNRRPRMNQISQELENALKDEVRRMRDTLSDLSSNLTSLRNELTDLKKNSNANQSPANVGERRNYSQTNTSEREKDHNRRKLTNSRTDRMVCFWCRQRGHYRADCSAFKEFQGHKARDKQEQPTGDTSTTFNQGPSRARGIAGEGDPKHAVILEVQLGSKSISAFLDTGCDYSIMGRRLIPTLLLQPTEQCLYAANGTSIPLLGQVQIQLGVKAGIMSTTVLVSDEIEGLILGIDWLTAHNCRWDFGNRCIEVDGCFGAFGNPTHFRTNEEDLYHQRR